MTKGGPEGGGGVTKTLVGFLPRSYFQPSSETLRPEAPVWRVLASFSFEVTTALVAFATMYWYCTTPIGWTSTCPPPRPARRKTE